MPTTRIEAVDRPFYMPRHTPDTSRLAALYTRMGETLANLALQRGDTTARGLAALSGLFSNYRGEKREEAATKAAIQRRATERAEDRAFTREQAAADRKARADERAEDAARGAARFAFENVDAGPVSGATADLLRRFPETAGLIRGAETLPARVTPGAVGEVSPTPEAFYVKEPTAEQAERSRARLAMEQARADAMARAKADDERQDRALRQQTAYQTKSLEIQQQAADTARMNAQTTRQRYTGGGVDTVKLGPFANILDRAVLTITPAKRGPILALAHRLADEGNTEELKSVIKQAAIEGENVDAKNQIRGRDATVAALEDARAVLAEMKRAGVPTNILTGTAEDIARRLGTSTDPRYVAFANQLEDALINYRRAATGVAFSERESAQYARMFPNYRQTMPVNEAAINGMIRAMQTNSRTYWENKLGKAGAALVMGYDSKPTSVQLDGPPGQVPARFEAGSDPAGLFSRPPGGGQ